MDERAERDRALAGSAAKLYRGRRERFARLEAAAERRSRRLSWARLAVFLLGVACLLVVLVQAGSPRPWPYAAAFAAFAVFALLVRLHAGVIRRQRRWASLVRVNERALARIDRDWERLPAPPRLPLPAAAAATVRDLDLFGDASLAQLLGAVATPPGRRTLAAWLTRGAPPAEIGRRQRVLRELAPRLGFRQRLETLAAELGELAPEPEAFLAWAEDEPWLAHRRWLRVAAWLLPLVSLALLAAAALGALPIHLWMLSLLANLGFGYAFRGPVHGTFARVSVRDGELARYGRVFAHLCRLPAAGALADPRRRLSVGGHDVAAQMDRLHRLVVLSDLRFSMLHPVVEALALWDLHVLVRVERWQREVGPRVRGWFEALAEIETLAAFSGLLHDEPAWCLPLVDDEAPPVLAARALGHPLLAAAERVVNDVEVGPPGSFLLVTGSNMSGKSTLLRALGINAVLAQAGAPACAAELAMPPLVLGTSIRVEDSLARGTSFFMAELERLKQVVDAAAGEPRLLYLLDEILRGTNSAERRIAVREVVEHLIAAGAIGAISTHDLELAGAEGLSQAARPVHFRETLHPPGVEPAMTFDYRLRPGVATTTNALRLLELVGLAPAEEPSPQ